MILIYNKNPNKSKRVIKDYQHGYKCNKTLDQLINRISLRKLKKWNAPLLNSNLNKQLITILKDQNNRNIREIINLKIANNYLIK